MSPAAPTLDVDPCELAAGTFGLGTCREPGRPGPGLPVIVLGGLAYPLGAAGGACGIEFHDDETMLGVLEQWERNWPLLQALAAALRDRPDLAVLARPCGQLDVRPPLAPRQVLCAGANYRRHVVELVASQAQDATRGMSPEERHAWGTRLMGERAAHGTPFFFVRTISSIAGPFDPVILPADVEQPDWELELAVVIGRRAHRVPRERALEHVAGYTIANDLTARDRVYRRPGDLREMGMDWLASKCAPTFLPLGPWLVPAAFVPDPQCLRITLRLNGDVMQDDSTADMIFDVARLIEHASRSAVLLPGDVICTGSPAGNGVHHGRFLRPGDVLEGAIGALGAQRTTCVAERG